MRLLNGVDMTRLYSASGFPDGLKAVEHVIPCLLTAALKSIPNTFQMLKDLDKDGLDPMIVVSPMATWSWALS